MYISHCINLSLYIHISILISIYLYIYRSAYLSICPHLYLSPYLPSFLYIYLSIQQSEKHKTVFFSNCGDILFINIDMKILLTMIRTSRNFHKLNHIISGQLQVILTSLLSSLLTVIGFRNDLWLVKVLYKWLL